MGNRVNGLGGITFVLAIASSALAGCLWRENTTRSAEINQLTDRVSDLTERLEKVEKSSNAAQLQISTIKGGPFTMTDLTQLDSRVRKLENTQRTQ